MDTKTKKLVAQLGEIDKILCEIDKELEEDCNIQKQVRFMMTICSDVKHSLKYWRND